MNTFIVVTSSGQESSLPGDKSVAQVISLLGADIPGLSGMDSSVSYDEDTGDKTIRFTPKTGNKG